MDESRLAIWVAMIITACWTASFVADMVIVMYEPPVIVTPLMLSVAGWLFGGETVRKLARRSEKVTDEQH